MDQRFDDLLPNDLSKVPGLRARFERSCLAGGVAGDELDIWKLIFTELVNNSIEHGCTRPQDTVRVRGEINAQLVRVTVTDPSEGSVTEASFDLTAAANFTDTGRGAGLFLIKEFSDGVNVRAIAGGTEIEVVKYRAGVEPPGVPQEGGAA